MKAHPVPVLRRLPWRAITAVVVAAVIVALGAGGIRACMADERRVARATCAALGGKVIDYRTALGGEVVRVVCRMPDGLIAVDLAQGACLTVDEVAP